VGHCGAIGALDWGGAAAVDGSQEGRRRSDEEVELGKRNAGEKEVRRRVNKVTEWSWSAC
jgi:hypothetical protein